MTQQKAYAPWNPPATTIGQQGNPGTMDATEVCTEKQAQNYKSLLIQLPAFAGFDVEVAVNPGMAAQPYTGQPDALGRSLWSYSVKNPKTGEAIEGFVGSELAQMFRPHGVGYPLTLEFVPQKGVSFPGHITYRFATPAVAGPVNEIEISEAAAHMLAAA